MVTKILNNDIGEALHSGAAVVDFSATWCGPCRMLAPVLEELADEKIGGAAYYSADTDANPQLAARYGIQNIPALVFFKNGEETGRSVGFLPKAQLTELVEKYCK